MHKKVYKKLKKTDPDITKIIWNLIIESSNILILSHKNPDGDALGSSLGLFHFLQLLNKKARIIIPDAFPDFLKWLPGSGEINVFNKSENECLEIMQEADLIICLDFNEYGRLGKMEQAILNLKKPSVKIDHHPGDGDKFDYCITDTKASSVAELVYKFIHTLNMENQIDIKAATCLYTGIMTDTGSFSYNSCGKDTFEIVSLLLNKEIDKEKIHEEVYDNFSSSRLKLLGYSINDKLTIIKELNSAYISLSIEELKSFNHQVGDTEGFVNYPLSIKGINFSAIFIEKKKHIKASFRSKGDIAANSFSKKYFNGGGHKNAAGGQISMSLKDALKYFEDSLFSFSKKMGI
ncbi:bifunctional oligoribonuclease/PAP phosphatase NrnA [Bacteroidota bacterium]